MSGDELGHPSRGHNNDDYQHPADTSIDETGAKKKHRIRDGFSAIRRKIFGSSASRTRASSPPGEEPPRKCKSTGNVLSDEYSRTERPRSELSQSADSVYPMSCPDRPNQQQQTFEAASSFDEAENELRNRLQVTDEDMNKSTQNMSEDKGLDELFGASHSPLDNSAALQRISVRPQCRRPTTTYNKGLSRNRSSTSRTSQPIQEKLKDTPPSLPKRPILVPKAEISRKIHGLDSARPFHPSPSPSEWPHMSLPTLVNTSDITSDTVDTYDADTPSPAPRTTTLNHSPPQRASLPAPVKSTITLPPPKLLSPVSLQGKPTASGPSQQVKLPTSSLTTTPTSPTPTTQPKLPTSLPPQTKPITSSQTIPLTTSPTLTKRLSTTTPQTKCQTKLISTTPPQTKPISTTPPPTKRLSITPPQPKPLTSTTPPQIKPIPTTLPLSNPPQAKPLATTAQPPALISPTPSSSAPLSLLQPKPLEPGKKAVKLSPTGSEVLPVQPPPNKVHQQQKNQFADFFSKMKPQDSRDFMKSSESLVSKNLNLTPDKHNNELYSAIKLRQVSPVDRNRRQTVPVVAPMESQPKPITVKRAVSSVSNNNKTNSISLPEPKPLTKRGLDKSSPSLHTDYKHVALKDASKTQQLAASKPIDSAPVPSKPVDDSSTKVREPVMKPTSPVRKVWRKPAPVNTSVVDDWTAMAHKKTSSFVADNPSLTQRPDASPTTSTTTTPLGDAKRITPPPPASSQRTTGAKSPTDVRSSVTSLHGANKFSLVGCKSSATTPAAAITTSQQFSPVAKKTAVAEPIAKSRLSLRPMELPVKREADKPVVSKPLVTYRKSSENRTNRTNEIIQSEVNAPSKRKSRVLDMVKNFQNIQVADA